MDELQERLNRLLENPAELEQMTRMAAQLMSGGGDAAPSAPSESPSMPDIGALLGSLRSGGSSDTQKLLQAMRPFLAARRQEKLSRAMRVARLASVAEIAMSRLGGEEESDESILREHGAL